MAHNWNQVLVSPFTSAEEALKVLDDGGLRLALVVDEDQRLKGILTDGDVRRALLKRIDFNNASVTDLMHVCPIIAREGASREMLRSLMKQHSLLHVPLVNEAGVLVGLETYHDLLQKPRYDNWIFLMAGGFGTRLRPLTNNCPKPMLPVNGKPMLESILESFIESGFHRFYISVHYLAETIKSHFGDGSKWSVTIKYIEEDQPLGTGGALGLLPDTSGLSLIMMNGDILTRLDVNALLDFHEAQQSELTMCVREYEMQVPFGVVKGQGSSVTEITEKPIHGFFVNAGIYVLSPAAMVRTRPARRVDMPDLVNQIIGDGSKVSMFPIREYWLDIGRPEDFDSAQTAIML
jgi:dTDP-glucose pyrophosphorylase/CBS domain-containing protein